MTVAILVISALSLVVQLAMGAGLIFVGSAIYRGVTEPLTPPQPAKSAPAQPEKPRIRLVEDK